MLDPLHRLPAARALEPVLQTNRHAVLQIRVTTTAQNRVVAGLQPHPSRFFQAHRAVITAAADIHVQGKGPLAGVGRVLFVLAEHDGENLIEVVDNLVVSQYKH